jgi:hypothetical protein
VTTMALFRWPTSYTKGVRSVPSLAESRHASASARAGSVLIVAPGGT